MNRVRKVTAADHFVVPAQSEAVVDVFIEWRDYDDFSSAQDYMLEPKDHFKETCPLQLAPSLANINKACTSKVRLLNPFPKAVSLKQDSKVGRSEPIDDSPNVIVPEESNEEVSNYNRDT